METIISDKVVLDLNPEKHGYVNINTIHGEKRSDKYILQLSLEGHSQSIKLNPASFKPPCNAFTTFQRFSLNSFCVLSNSNLFNEPITIGIESLY